MIGLAVGFVDLAVTVSHEETTIGLGPVGMLIDIGMRERGRERSSLMKLTYRVGKGMPRVGNIKDKKIEGHEASGWNCDSGKVVDAAGGLGGQ